MAPDQQSEEGDGDRGPDHGPIAEDRSARKIRDEMRHDSHARKNRDVDLGVPEEPEEMLPEQGRSAAVRDGLVADEKSRGHEETGAAEAVEQNERAGGQQHRERKRLRMAVTNQFQQVMGMRIRVMPGRAQIDHSRDDIDGGEQRRDRESGDAEEPQRLAEPFAGTGDCAHYAKRSIGGPAGKRAAADGHERSEEYGERRGRDPERKQVEARKGHLLRADLFRQHEIAKRIQRRQREDEKHHDGAVQREDREIKLRRHHPALCTDGPESGEPPDLGLRKHQMKAHEQRKQDSEYDGEEREKEIQARDGAMVRAEEH